MTGKKVTTRAKSQELTPLQMIGNAMERGADIETIRELRALQKEWEADEAQKAYTRAMTQFRADCPQIIKTLKGHNTTYAGLAETIDQIKNLMSANGLSHSWKVNSDSEQISVTCCLRHVDGHSESTTMAGPPDKTGSKNSIQAIGSTVKYLQRYTLFSLLGLASQDKDDDDGRAAGGYERISEEQSALLYEMAEAGGVLQGFEKWLKDSLKCNSIDDINIKVFDQVKKKIQTSIKAKEAQNA
jgi:hypothetical protein